MTFSEAVRTVLRHKYADFSGRAAKAEYWWFMLFNCLAYAGCIILAVLWGRVRDHFHLISPFLLIHFTFFAVFCALSVPNLALSVRRLHDLNYSGWWYLAVILLRPIPPIGIFIAVIWIIVVCSRGSEGANRFGADPIKNL